MNPLIEPIIASPFFVGLIGALVGLKFSPGSGLLQRLTNVMCGAAIAGYCAQPLGDWLRLDKHSDVLGVAFVCGILGLSIIAAAVRAIGELKIAEIVTGWLSRRG